VFEVISNPVFRTFYFLKTLLPSKSLAIHVIFYPIWRGIDLLTEEEIELAHMMLHVA
jgi:hypothetical protein